jgi:hypothetical protein
MERSASMLTLTLGTTRMTELSAKHPGRILLISVWTPGPLDETEELNNFKTSKNSTGNRT